MSSSLRILVVDHDRVVAENLSEFLQQERYATCTTSDPDQALVMLESPPPTAQVGQPARFGLMIADMNLQRGDGLELLRAARKKHPAVAVIMVTGYGRIESAVEAVKLGAVDYLTKPLVDDELRIAVGKAAQHHALLAENQTLRSQLHQRYGLGSLVGTDYRMQKVYELIEAVAGSRTTVVISGESGTGKTMVARAVHTQSARAAGPFVTFSCGAIPETLLESELFGHVKGAFTGAVADKAGRILAADGGTLFIDEINSATPALQLKLLRVLQDKQFEPVGAGKTTTVDIRFVLATNQPLGQLVEAGKFREDLYYRINVVNITLPPLRDRVGDIPALTDHFLATYCTETGKTVTSFTADAIEALRRYHWPGNVRELENAMERAVVLSRRPVIDLEDLPETVHRQPGTAAPNHHVAGGNGAGRWRPDNGQDPWNPMPLAEALREPERQILLAALEANNWNRQITSSQLQINRSTLYKKIKQYKLDQPN